MNSIIRHLTVLAVVVAVSMSTAFAGQCCKETASKVKAGELCDKCMKADAAKCCKETAKKTMKDKDTKECKACMEKKKKSEAATTTK
jgi:hypothetical protein